MHTSVSTPLPPMRGFTPAGLVLAGSFFGCGVVHSTSLDAAEPARISGTDYSEGVGETSRLVLNKGLRVHACSLFRSPISPNPNRP